MNRNQEFFVKEWEMLSMDVRPKVRYWVPAAAMDEADLREELGRLAARGFGGVEVVALLATPEEIINGEDGWGTENWNHFVDIIAEETRKQGMSMDLANGPMWPISMPGFFNVDAPGTLCELTWGMLEIPESGCYEGGLPKREKIRPEGTPRIEAVMAYRQNPEGKLVMDTCTPLCRELWGKPAEPPGGISLQVQLPVPAPGSRWLLFAF